MNPSSVAKQQRGEELEKLRRENESLRRKLQILEVTKEGGCGPEDVSLGLSQIIPEGAPSVAKQVEGQCFVFELFHSKEHPD